MLVRIENWADPNQTASTCRSSLIWVWTVCLGLFDRQLVLKFLEHFSAGAVYNRLYSKLSTNQKQSYICKSARSMLIETDYLNYPPIRNNLTSASLLSIIIEMDYNLLGMKARTMPRRNLPRQKYIFPFPKH